MDNSNIKADDAKFLQKNGTFQLLLKEVRENQTKVFATSAADEIERARRFCVPLVNVNSASR